MAEYDKGRYYWIKLTDRFMTSDTVDFLMSQKDGANYVVLYQMLCLKTVNNDGVLARSIGEMIIPYDIEKIQRDCKWFTVDTVRVALELYKKLGLIYEHSNGVLAITDFDRLIGSQSEGALKKQQQLARRRQESATSGKKVEIFPPEIRDKEIRDKDIDNIEEQDVHFDVVSAPVRTQTEVLFDEFWASYPKKVNKKGAFKSFSKIKGLETEFPLIMDALERFKKSREWQKDGGQFIPHPTTWLNQERWKDEQEPTREQILQGMDMSDWV